MNQALADSIEKQEKMHADAEAFWQASDEFIDAYAEVSDARSKIFDEDETTAKQAEKESEKATQKLDELDSQKLAPHPIPTRQIPKTSQKKPPTPQRNKAGNGR